MRLAVTSDLHLPKTPAALIEGLVAEVAAFAPDAVVLAGDLGESSEEIEPCLALFGQLPCPVLVLAVNHDLFPGRSNSQLLWTHVLPEIAAEGSESVGEDDGVDPGSAHRPLLPAAVVHRPQGRDHQRHARDGDTPANATAGLANVLGAAASGRPPARSYRSSNSQLLDVLRWGRLIHL